MVNEELWGFDARRTSAFGRLENAGSTLAIVRYTRLAIDAASGSSELIGSHVLRSSDSIAQLFMFVAEGRRFDLLVVRDGDCVVDVAAVPAASSSMLSLLKLPRNPFLRVITYMSGLWVGVSPSQIRRNVENFSYNSPWNSAILTATRLHVASVWQEVGEETSIGLRPDGRANKVISIQCNRFAWEALSASRQEAILTTTAATVKRLFGLDRRAQASHAKILFAADSSSAGRCEVLGEITTTLRIWA